MTVEEAHAPLPDMSGEILVDLLHEGTDPVMTESIRQMLERVHSEQESYLGWSSHIE